MESFFNEEGWCYTVSYDEIYSKPSISEHYGYRIWAPYLVELVNEAFSRRLVEFLFSYYVFTKID